MGPPSTVGPLWLGAFQLVAPIARGAAGEVWRAAHGAERLPVAIKVLAAPLAGDPRHLRQFQDEIRALASLDHPAIVTLLDAGTVDVATAASSSGRLLEGSPWLALEYASDGTVGDRAPTRWPEIRDLAFTILDALAHAHARGLVHRDLKPANLLWCGARDARPGLKLTDFGIAIRMGDLAPGELPAGTPQYMAPEQLGGELSDVGPWTDLYSLGCLVWRLTTGALPFEGLKRMALVRAHLSKAPPPFQPRTEVPAGLEEWLRALLEKRPEDRPQRAADAAAALALLDASGTGAAARMWAAVLRDDVELVPFDDPLLEDPTAQLRMGIGPPAGIPDWREPGSVRPPELLGAGMGLIGLRDPPVVGRGAEQELLWDQLRMAAEGGAAQVVALRGPAGQGRTRLGRWLCTRADEVGAARVVWTDHAAGGLRSTVHHLLRVGERQGEDRARWLLELLGDPDLATSAGAFLDDRLAEHERGAIGARLVGHSDRTTVLCVDDAHRSEADLDAVAELIASPRALLVLLLIDDQECTPSVEARLHRLGALQVRLPPLPPGARRELCAALLRLAEPLAAQIEERSQGSPAFLVELVSDWVSRDWLVAGPQGFTLRPEVSTGAIPETRTRESSDRVDRVLAGAPPATGWDLTMAAALGPVVDESCWHSACDDPDGTGAGWARDGVARRTTLVDRLLRARVLTPQDRGFVLHHAFRAEVVARARATGRWARVCATAARILGARGLVDRFTLGTLLLEARQPAAALPELLAAANEALTVSARRALSMWVEAEHASHLAGVAPDAEVALELELLRVRIDLALGDPAAARTHLPARPRTAALRLAAGVCEVQILLASGDHDAAGRLAAALRSGDVDLETRGRLLLYESEALERTDPLASLARLEEAREAWSRAGVSSEQLATLTFRQASRTRQRGDGPRARVLLEKVLDEVGPRGDPRLRVQAGAALAELLARLGDPARGAAAARRASAAGDATGNPAIEARIAAGICRMLSGESDAAADFDGALRAARNAGRLDLARQAHCGLACAHAALGEWGRVHDHLRDVERSPLGPGRDDPVATGLLRDLVRLAKAGGYPQLQARARALVAM